MIVSVNWLKQFTDIDIPTSELASLIGARLVEIEEVVDLGKKYDGVIVAKVIECEKLEGSDHLNVTKIDDGNTIKEVERDENGLVQVVCGAPNVRAGITVAWLPPKSVVPETFGDKEPFVLGARKLRGVVSNGMLASAKELDLFDDHEGILEIDGDITPGTRFAEVYQLDDQLLDIENKSLTHRPDAFGIVGFAREVAAIQGKPFKTPDWLLNTTPHYADIEADIDEKKITVAIDSPELSERYQAVVLSDVALAAKSPVDAQTYLARVGVRPISAVVDVTNYLMMLTGQPLHAFDYDKLAALNGGVVTIHVRAGKPGEKLELLDGREIELSAQDIVIANGETPVALAGAMGGKATEVDDATKNILLESATFNLYNLRNTQMRHGIFSEAITRFTKGQPAALTAPVLAAAVRLLQTSAGAKRASEVVDAYPSGNESAVTVALSVSKINETLGVSLQGDEIVSILQNSEFVAVLDEGGELTVHVPYWRADIHIAEDIIEEVGRLNGFDAITPTLPLRDFTAVSATQYDTFRAEVRHVLSRAGANEVLTYNFVHGDILRHARQKLEDSYRITNSISPALQYYRQTMTPNLLNLVRMNTKAGYSDFALFELGKTHNKKDGLDEDGVPVEAEFLAFVIAHKSKQAQAAYYEAKHYLAFLAERLGVKKLRFEPLKSETDFSAVTVFERRRSSAVYDEHTNRLIGVVGEFNGAVKKAFKLTDATAGFEIDPKALYEASRKQGSVYEPLGRFPSAERDVCYKVKHTVEYGAIEAAAGSVVNDSVKIAVTPLDIYRAKDADTKNVTLRYLLTPKNATLTADDVEKVVASLNDAVVTKTDAQIV